MSECSDPSVEIELLTQARGLLVEIVKSRVGKMGPHTVYLPKLDRRHCDMLCAAIGAVIEGSRPAEPRAQGQADGRDELIELLRSVPILVPDHPQQNAVMGDELRGYFGLVKAWVPKALAAVIKADNQKAIYASSDRRSR